MADEPLDNPDVLAALRGIAQDSCDIDPLISELLGGSDGENGSPEKYGRHFSASTTKYTTVIARIDTILRQCKHLMAEIDSDATSGQISGMSSAGHSAMPSRPSSVAYIPPSSIQIFENFLARELPRVGVPYPPLCGAVPIPKDDALAVGSFVAAHVSDMWTLCYIIRIDATGYMICDAESDASTAFHADREGLIPLPTSLPARRTRFAEHAEGSRVLALWPEGATWTSVFYPAEVVKTQSETGDTYRLRFLEDVNGKTKDIPPQFVISDPEPNSG